MFGDGLAHFVSKKKKSVISFLWELRKDRYLIELSDPIFPNCNDLIPCCIFSRQNVQLINFPDANVFIMNSAFRTPRCVSCIHRHIGLHSRNIEMPQMLEQRRRETISAHDRGGKYAVVGPVRTMSDLMNLQVFCWEKRQRRRPSGMWRVFRAAIKSRRGNVCRNSFTCWYASISSAHI